MNTFLHNSSRNRYERFISTNSSSNWIILIQLKKQMARITKFLKVVMHLTILMLISHFLKRQDPSYTVKKIARHIADMKHILLWTHVPGIEEEGQRYFVRNQCSFLNCYFTMNRSLFPDLRYFDAIVFNAQDVSRYARFTHLPPVRSFVQKYIFASNDSSHNYPVCSSQYDNYFNWTWTYKLDSSIPYRYITVFNIHNEELGADLHWKYDMKPISAQFRSSLDSKSLAAAIYLEKCSTNSKREYYIKNLQAQLALYNLTVDIYGPCGNKKCGRTSMKPFFYKLRRHYYFYLAFEDSLTDDFITSSVLFGYQNNAVPVVLGGANYQRFLPPSSYLEASQMEEQTAAKIMYDIIQNKTRYYEFFSWRNHYSMKESTILNACTLCQFMNHQGWLKHSTSYKNFRKWWNPFYEEYCGVSKYL